MNAHAILLSAALIRLPAQAMAEDVACLPYADMRKELLNTYKEQAIGAGIINASAVIQLFVALDNSTWTLVAIGSDGNACIVATGINWDEPSQSVATAFR